MRGQSPTNQLAVWFVNTFLNRGFDYRVDGFHLKKAKELINPKIDPVTHEHPKAYTLDEVKEALLALRDGTTPVTDFMPFNKWSQQRGWKGPNRIKSLGILFTVDTSGPLIEALLAAPEPPEVYETQEYADWVLKYGKKAIRQGKWDGIFPWFPSENPVSCSRMNFATLVEIVGDELATESLEKWKKTKEESERVRKE